ncbi:DUF1360 domain-containing protein [Bacillus sp. HNG]|uniref:DUF1360 domain-containing protein n=1 Tax=Bacillus sp. HNG TaxID=2293325 RepID=UPI001677F486|nr:DUF1360 domain-containing protein [Bacillus sp. HNG]
MNVFEFVLLGLASFRLTRLIVFDKVTEIIRRPFHEVFEETLPDGTVEEFIHIKGTGLKKWIGELLSCYWCTGIWATAFLYILYEHYFPVSEPLILIFGIAGLASIIETCVIKILN